MGLCHLAWFRRSFLGGLLKGQPQYQVPVAHNGEQCHHIAFKLLFLLCIN